MVATSSKSAPLVTVIGSTGNQGGSVIRALIESDKQYRLRGITRDASKAPAQELKKQGVDVFEADLNDQSRLVDAVKDANYVFAVTDFWRTCDVNVEVKEGKAIVDAVAQSKATLLWSGLDSYAGSSNGKYKNVDHYEGKYQITQYARQQKVPVIVVQPGWYITNIKNMLKKQENGSLMFIGGYPAETVLPVTSIQDDYGLFVRSAIENGYQHGDELFSTSEDIAIGKAIEQVSEVIGKPINFVCADDQSLKGAFTGMFHSERLGQEMFEMVAHQREFGYYESKTGTKDSLAKLPKATLSVKQWAEQQDWSSFK